jgi:hypothetical protein
MALRVTPSGAEGVCEVMKAAQSNRAPDSYAAL